nr:pantothenate kinase [Calothrix rhizosoleniae]
METYLALMIGNSRLHWGLFTQKGLELTWDTDYFGTSTIHRLVNSLTQEQFSSDFLPENISTALAHHVPENLFIASVVPSQTKLWHKHHNVRIITLEQVPLQGVYSSLGIDRALALWGAGKTWGFPILVIDGGTALTFTSADINCSLVGGAILPGLGLQISTLGEKTGQLPHVNLPLQLPPRYAINTQEAIQSGIIYTIMAGIKDFVEIWWRDFPQGKVVITGGDRQILVNYLQLQFPAIAKHLIMEANLIFLGMGEIIALRASNK